jgi:hypothetical protein
MGDLIQKPDHRQKSNAEAARRYFDILNEIQNRLQGTE